MNTENTLFPGITPSSHPSLVLDYAGIKQVIPHRYPFLFVDGVYSIEKGTSISAFKNFTHNEEFFNGHFPQEPVVPGVIQIEAMAQVGCILLFLSFDELKGKRPAFAGIVEAKFKMPVRPGDTLVMNLTIDKYRRGFAVLKAEGKIRDQVAVEAIIKASAV